MDRRVLIVVLFLVLVVPSVLIRDYWDPDEGRYAAVAREMWKGDGALVPHLNGEVYGEKPPLFFWMIAACQKVAGSTAAPISRIPSALSTLVAAFLLLGIVRRTHGEKEAVLAAAFYLSSVLVFQMAGWVGIDALVTVLVVATVYTQVRARDANGRPFRWHLLSYVLLAAIVLAKGAPLVIAVIALGGYAVLADGWRGLFPRHLLWGVPLLALLLAAWALPAAFSFEEGWDYIRGLTIGQAEKRIAAAQASHERPVWYYITNFPALFFPATLLIPAAVAVSVREWRAGGAARRETGRYVLWFGIAFLLFTMIKGKRERYILPLFPAAAALVAIALVRLEGARLCHWLLRVPLFIVLAVLGILGVGIAACPFVFDDLVVPRIDALAAPQMLLIADRIRAALPIFVAGGLSATVVALDGIFRRRERAPAVPVLASFAFLVFTVGVAALPALDRAKSYGRLVAPVVEAQRPGARYGLAGLRSGPFLMALDRHDLVLVPLKGRRKKIAESLRSDPDVVWFTRTEDLGPLQKKWGAEFEVLAVRQVGRREIAAIRRK